MHPPLSQGLGIITTSHHIEVPSTLLDGQDGIYYTTFVHDIIASYCYNGWAPAEPIHPGLDFVVFLHYFSSQHYDMITLFFNYCKIFYILALFLVRR
jgi:hypothetical protein